MELKEKILEKCAEKIAVMERSDCPSSTKEEAIMKRKTSKQILEIICDIQGIDVYTAIQILQETETIIKGAAMSQEISCLVKETSEQVPVEDDKERSNSELLEGRVFTNAQRHSLGLKCRSEDERLMYSVLHILGDNGLSVDRASRVLSDAQTMLPTLAKLPMLTTGKARI